MNETVQILYNWINFLVEELIMMSFDHLTLITVVIVGCQCITVEQNRY